MTVVVNMYLTWQCNFFCDHCIHECGPKVKEHMTDEEINYAFGFIDWVYQQNLSVCVLGLTGGEPTMHPKFWSRVMPGCWNVKTKYNMQNVEMHTNASIPVPETFPKEYTAFFSNIYVGHDMWHRKFKQLNELDLKGYASISKDLHIRNGSAAYDPKYGMMQCVRKKGRAKEFDNKKYDYLHIDITKPDCTIYRDYFTALYVNFVPSYINFCGEKSHAIPGLKEGQFLPYSTSFEDVLQKSALYGSCHANKKCSNPCWKAFVREKPPFVEHGEGITLK